MSVNRIITSLTEGQGDVLSEFKFFTEETLDVTELPLGGNTFTIVVENTDHRIGDTFTFVDVNALNTETGIQSASLVFSGLSRNTVISKLCSLTFSGIIVGTRNFVITIMGTESVLFATRSGETVNESSDSFELTYEVIDEDFYIPSSPAMDPSAYFQIYAPTGPNVVQPNESNIRIFSTRTSRVPQTNDIISFNLAVDNVKSGDALVFPTSDFIWQVDTSGGQGTNYTIETRFAVVDTLIDSFFSGIMLNIGQERGARIFSLTINNNLLGYTLEPAVSNVTIESNTKLRVVEKSSSSSVVTPTQTAINEEHINKWYNTPAYFWTTTVLSIILILQVIVFIFRAGFH